MGGTVALHFMMYNEPYGGAAYWRETQNVRPDAEGGYTVLLGLRWEDCQRISLPPVECSGSGCRSQDNRNNHACCWWNCPRR